MLHDTLNPADWRKHYETYDSLHVEGMREILYKDFLVPEEYQDDIFVAVENRTYIELWVLISECMPNLPRGESMEIVNKFVDDLGAMQRYYVRVHKPRKPLESKEF